MQQDENLDGFSRVVKNGNSEVLLARITEYEEELRVAKEKMLLSVKDIARLKIEL